MYVNYDTNMRPNDSDEQNQINKTNINIKSDGHLTTWTHSSQV